MKVIVAREAAALLRNGWTIAASGFGGFGHPETLTDAVEKRFLAEGRPRDLTLLFAASNGDRRVRGMNHFGNEGMVRRVIAGGWRGTPRLGALAIQGKIEAYNWPQGVICQLFRAIAAGQPGLVTRTGLDTFVDPRHDGGRLNNATAKDLVRLLRLDGEEYLLYPAMRLDCALIRATSADALGNLTLEHEAFPQDMLAIAQAARNSGGIVIAQVKRVVEARTLDPTRVRVPGMLVDYVVVAESEAQHWMSFGEKHNPAYLGDRSAPLLQPAPGAQSDVNRVIQRRAYLELLRFPGAIVNLGMGIPAGIATIAREQGYANFTLTIESGVSGGVAAEELSFGAASHPESVIDQAAQFDFYAGGGLDLGFLGMLQIDASGNVNVGRMQEQIIGTGGFIDIAQGARAICFLGTFTAGGLRIEASDGRLRILEEGKLPKIVPSVDQMAFNAKWARHRGRRVLYITERAVFGLEERGLVLLEVAPGIDPRRQVIERLPPGVCVPERPASMAKSIFGGPFAAAEHQG